MRIMKECMVAGLLIGGGVLVGCANPSTQNEASVTEESDSKTETFTYTKFDLPLANKVYMGDKDAKHEIVFVFDYSCPWCKKWIDQILPVVEERFISSGEAIYKGQPLVLLNQDSQYMANVDYHVENYNPDDYYDVQKQLSQDFEHADWATDNYVDAVSKQFGLVGVEQLTSEEGIEVGIQNSRAYTRDMGVEYVPTVYVDGIKLFDSFNVDEIADVMNGNLSEGDVIEVDRSE